MEMRREELRSASSQRRLQHDPMETAESERETADSRGSTLYGGNGGYVFIDVLDEYKGLFHDAIRGFEEFARLKGYRVSIAVDTTPPGKVGFKFTILNQGVTVSTETVRSDVDAYIAKFRKSESDALDDLPIIIDPVEHERLKAGLTARFTMVKNNAEMYKTLADFYRQFAFDMSRFGAGGVSYLPLGTNVINQIEYTGPRTSGDTFSAVESPGAAVGKGNTTAIEGSTITIGSTLTAKNEQVNGLSELLELVRQSGLENKDDAVRQLTNAKEELADGDPPDAGLIARFLGKANHLLSLAEEGTELYEKASKVMQLFCLAG